jgi:hypothetical protein
MAAITPNVGVGTASLGSPLITPGFPMAAVQKSSPLAEMGPPAAAELPIPSATVRRDQSLTQAGEIASGVNW